jgi:hypothetical protein
MYRFTSLQRFAIAFLFVTPLALTIIMWAPADGMPEPFTLVALVWFTLLLWAPLFVYVHDTIKSVGDWAYDSGNWVRKVWYNDDVMDVYVQRKPHTKNSYYVWCMADDSDYFDDECRTVVYEYKDYGHLYNVLSNAEVCAIDLLVEKYNSSSPF